MRVYIHNDKADAPEMTPEMWGQAVSRSGTDAAAHEVGFGASPAEFEAAMARAEAVVIGAGTLRRFIPLQAPAAKIVFCTSAGVDRLMPPDWLPPGCALLNNSGVHAQKTGEYAAMALLMLNARIPDAIAAQREQNWTQLLTPSLRGRRVTIVGTGSLGAGSARAARLFGAAVIGVSRSGRAHDDFDRVVTTDGLDALLPETDFLLLACPLTPETRELLNARRIAMLPAGAGVINVGRGGLVAQDALCDALDAGRLGGAVLDVFTPEPLPPGHRAWTTRNLIVTGHNAADDPTTYYQHSLDIFLANVAAFGRGEPMPNRIDLDRGY